MNLEKSIEKKEVNLEEKHGEEKTFSQDDVNRIVQDRLAKDRAKASEELSRKEQELNKREFRLNSRQKLIDRGYPESIMDALNCSSTEAFEKALDIIDNLIKDRAGTPSAEQQQLELKRAQFAPVPQRRVFFDNDDPLRKAMGLKE